jgi:hypothetical protein
LLSRLFTDMATRLDRDARIHGAAQAPKAGSSGARSARVAPNVAIEGGWRRSFKHGEVLDRPERPEAGMRRHALGDRARNTGQSLIAGIVEDDAAAGDNVRREVLDIL